MTNRVKSCPWSDWNEWSYVRELLLRNNESSREAIDIVGMWRCRGKLPHSIDSTAALIETSLNDRSAYRSESELRLIYSMVITRAVNGLVDPAQQGYYADSVSNLADKIGLPQWFVELRHDATHGLLPSLNVLRSATYQLLTWLIDNYWIPQFEYLQQISILCLPSDVESRSDSLRQDLLFGTASTVTSQLFLPIFIQSIYHVTDNMNSNEQGSDSTGFSSKSDVIKLPNVTTEKTFESIYAVWKSTLINIIKTNPQIIHLIFCYIIKETIPIKPESNICLDNRILCARYWIVKFQKLVASNSASKTIFTNSKNIQQINLIISTCNSVNITKLDTIIGLIKSNYSIEENYKANTNDITDDNDKVSIKRQKKDHKSVIISPGSPWPLGCVAGHLPSEFDLYRIDYT